MFWGALFRGLVCPGFLTALLLGLLWRGLAAWLGAHLRRRPWGLSRQRAAPPAWLPLGELGRLATKKFPVGRPRELAWSAWPALLGLVALSWATGMLPWNPLGLPTPPAFAVGLPLYLLCLAVPPLARLWAAGLSGETQTVLHLSRQVSLELARLLPLLLGGTALLLHSGQLSLLPEPTTTLWPALLMLALALLLLILLPWPFWDRNEQFSALSALGGRPLALFRALEALELSAHVGLVALVLAYSGLFPTLWAALLWAGLATLLVLSFLERAGRWLPLAMRATFYTRCMLPIALLLVALSWWFA
ncbi:MAG: hypothetical protein JXA37_08990 [Chloroflexia bacterium]|nr:hypothetical protein [Chloroflexia bacterium]